MARNFNAAKAAAYDREYRRQYAAQIMGLSAHERHTKLVSDYLRFYGGGNDLQQQAQGGGGGGLAAAAAAGVHRPKTDLDALQEQHRFIRTAADDADSGSWEVRLARRYYGRLFKEYCIADLSRYRESKLGLRWRTQKEVVAGKGQFTCGAKGCEQRTGLCSYEVNFAYDEAGQRKQALVKLRVCPDCAGKLNYGREKQYRKAPAAAAALPADAAAAAAAGAKRKRRSPSPAAERDEREYLNRPPPAAAAAAASGAAPQAGDVGVALTAAAAGGSAAAAGPAAGGTSLQQLLPADETVWAAKQPQLEANPTEELFDQYFEGMFL